MGFVHCIQPIFLPVLDLLQALLAEIVREQKNVELERQNMRILIHPGEIKAAQQAIQDQVSEVTLTCKTVKSKLDQLDQLYARTLESDAVSPISLGPFSLQFPPQVSSASSLNFGNVEFASTPKS